jgi:phospholipase/carboxylesterase
MQDMTLTCNIRPPKEPSDQPPLLLLLHGYGSNEKDLVELTPYLDPRFLTISVRAPETLAPDMYAWFPIEFVPGGINVNASDAQKAFQTLERFISELPSAYTFNSEKIYLMGFSQGAVMSYLYSFFHPDQLAGTVAMSGRVPPKDMLADIDQASLTNFPIFACHGLYDEVISIDSGRECKTMLETLPVSLSYHEYPMGHQVSYESLKDISEWLTRQLDQSA